MSKFKIFLFVTWDSAALTLDNVQIKAKTGIDIRFVENLVFKNGSKITKSSGNMWITNYDSIYSDECGATE